MGNDLKNLVQNEPRRTGAWLVGLNVLGSLLVMIAMHAPPGMAVPPTFTAGWHSPLAGVEAVLASPTIKRAVLGVLFVLLAAIYLISVATVIRRKLKAGPKRLVLWTLLIAVPLLALPRMLSSDVYLYAMYGRMIAVHGQNPFFHVPAEFAGDPVLSFTQWEHLKSVYGPLWLIISVPVTWLAAALGGTPAAHVLSFKLLGLVCHLMNTWLIARILGLVRPAAQTWGTLLYAWNPFALMELVGSAHNDGLMITCILLGCLMEVRGRRKWALIAFVCAGMVKLPGGLLAPAYVLYVARERLRNRGSLDVGVMLRSVGGQMMIGLATAALLYAPFWRGMGTLEHLSSGPNSHKLLNSPAARVYWALETRLGAEEAKTAGNQSDVQTGQPGLRPSRQRLTKAIALGSLVSFAAVYAGLTLMPIRSRQAFFERGFWILAAYCSIAAFDFHPWYIVWLMAMLTLMERVRVVLWVGVCAVFILYLPMQWNEIITAAFLPLGAVMIVGIVRGCRLIGALRLPADEVMAVARATT